MSLNAGALQFDAAGRIVGAAGSVVVAFNGGTPVDATGALAASGLEPATPPPQPPDDPEGPWEWDFGGGTPIGTDLVLGTGGITGGALDLSSVGTDPATQRFAPTGTSGKGFEDLQIVAYVTHTSYNAGDFYYGFVARANNFKVAGYESYAFLVNKTGATETIRIVRTTGGVDTVLATVTLALTDGVVYRHEITAIGPNFTFKVYDPANVLVADLSATDYFYAAGQVAFKMKRTGGGSLGGLLNSMVLTDLSPGGADAAWTWENQSTTLGQITKEGTMAVEATGASSLGASDTYWLRLNNATTATWSTQQLTADNVLAPNGTLEAFMRLPPEPAGSPSVGAVELAMRASGWTNAAFNGVAVQIAIEGVASGSRFTMYLLERQAGANTQIIGSANNLNYASPIIPVGGEARITLTCEGPTVTARLYSWPANALLLTLSMVSYVNVNEATVALRAYVNRGGGAGDTLVRAHEAAFYRSSNPLNSLFRGRWGTASDKLVGGAVTGAHGEIATQTLGTSDMNVMSEDPIPMGGKWYWEVQCDQAGAQLQDVIGIGYGTNNVDCAAGESGHSTLMFLLSPGLCASTAAATQWAGPARLGFAYDTVAKKMWVSVNGTYLAAGNPATGANPYFYNIADPVAGAQMRVWARGASDGVISTIKLYSARAQQTYAVPSGFQPLTSDAYWTTLDYIGFLRSLPGYEWSNDLGRRGTVDSTTQTFYDDSVQGFRTALPAVGGLFLNTSRNDGGVMNNIAAHLTSIAGVGPLIGRGRMASTTPVATQTISGARRFNPFHIPQDSTFESGTPRCYVMAIRTTAPPIMWNYNAYFAVGASSFPLSVQPDTPNKRMQLNVSYGNDFNYDVQVYTPNNSLVIDGVAWDFLIFYREGFGTGKTFTLWANGQKVTTGATGTWTAVGASQALGIGTNTYVGTGAGTEVWNTMNGSYAEFARLSQIISDANVATLFSKWQAAVAGAGALLASVLAEARDLATPFIEAINTYVGGLPYDAEDRLVVEADVPASWVNGIPMTAAGGVAIDTEGAITHWLAGLPRTATGALAVAAPELLGAFSDGFDDGFDV